jgi:hypothetical protein
MAGTIGILYLVDSPQHLLAFGNAPEPDYVVLLSQTMFAQPAVVTALSAMAHFKGALVFEDGSSTPFSADDRRPNYMQGWPNGAGGRMPVDWNAAGGGYNRFLTNSSEGVWSQRLPMFAYLDPVDAPSVFQVNTMT